MLMALGSRPLRGRAQDWRTATPPLQDPTSSPRPCARLSPILACQRYTLSSTLACVGKQAGVRADVPIWPVRQAGRHTPADSQMWAVYNPSTAGASGCAAHMCPANQPHCGWPAGALPHPHGAAAPGQLLWSNNFQAKPLWAKQSGCVQVSFEAKVVHINDGNVHSRVCVAGKGQSGAANHQTGMHGACYRAKCGVRCSTAHKAQCTQHSMRSSHLG